MICIGVGSRVLLKVLAFYLLSQLNCVAVFGNDDKNNTNMNKNVIRKDFDSIFKQ